MFHQLWVDRKHQEQRDAAASARPAAMQANAGLAAPWHATATLAAPPNATLPVHGYAPAAQVPVAPQVNLQYAVVTMPDQLDQAISAWGQVMSTVSSDGRTNVTVTFSAPGTMIDPQALHLMVGAMGIQINGNSTAGLPTRAVLPPYGSVAGDATQPAVVVTWQLAPEAKTTIQLNTKRGTLALKGRRGPMDARLELLLTFMGAPVRVEASAFSAKKAPAPSPGVNIRDMLVANARNTGL